MEYSMIVLDNSDYSRNGDYVPTRWEAQIDAALLLSSAKINANQESAVGIITMAEQQPQVLITPTNEDLKIKASFFGVKQNGRIHFKNALSIAYLALKHRKNIVARQRIIVFVASPVYEDQETLVKLAKQFKKNKVAVDLVNIGEMDTEHTQKLEKFIETLNSEDNSHYLNIEPGLGKIEDKLMGTPLMGEFSMNQGGGNNFNFGGDFGGGFEAEDPQMAEIIKLSEQTYAEEQAKRKQQDGGSENLQTIEEETKTDNKQEQQGSNQQNQGKMEEEEDMIKRAENIVKDNNTDKKDKEKEKDDEYQVQDKEFMDELEGLVSDIKKDEKDQNNNDKNKKDDNDKK